MELHSSTSRERSKTKMSVAGPHRQRITVDMQMTITREIKESNSSIEPHAMYFRAQVVYFRAQDEIEFERSVCDA